MAHQIVTKEMLRSPGEQGALLAAATSFLAVLLVLGLASFGSVLLALGVALIGGMVKVMLEQSRRRRTSVMVTRQQIPRVHRIVEAAASNLTYGEPSVYIQQSPELNAYAMSLFSSEHMVVNSGLIESLNDRELQFVIGHELTHMKCGHTFWRIVGGHHPVLRMPLVSFIGGLFLRWWGRKAELSADRGGLVAAGDVHACIRALLILAVGVKLAAEVDVDAIVRQSVAADSDLLGTVAGLDATHPDTATRVRELIAFSNSNGFKQALVAA